jgi:hypothetical protein
MAKYFRLKPVNTALLPDVIKVMFIHGDTTFTDKSATAATVITQDLSGLPYPCITISLRESGWLALHTKEHLL